jgi:hypothetical protein
LVEGTPGRLLFVDKMNLILSDLLGPEFLDGLAEELAEFIDVVGVGVDGVGGQIADLHVLDHALDVGVQSFVERSHDGSP